MREPLAEQGQDFPDSVRKIRTISLLSGALPRIYKDQNERSWKTGNGAE